MPGWLFLRVQRDCLREADVTLAHFYCRTTCLRRR